MTRLYCIYVNHAVQCLLVFSNVALVDRANGNQIAEVEMTLIKDADRRRFRFAMGKIFRLKHHSMEGMGPRLQARPCSAVAESAAPGEIRTGPSLRLPRVHR